MKERQVGVGSAVDERELRRVGRDRRADGRRSGLRIEVRRRGDVPDEAARAQGRVPVVGGGARRDERHLPRARQRQRVRAGAVVRRLIAVGAVARDRVVAEGDAERALPAGFGREAARVETEVGAPGAPTVGAVAVVGAAAAEIERREREGTLVIQPVVLAGLGRGAADVADADFRRAGGDVRLGCGIRCLGRWVLRRRRRRLRDDAVGPDPEREEDEEAANQSGSIQVRCHGRLS